MFIARESFLYRVILKDSARVTAFGATLVLFSLTLGFFLNAALWMWMNPRFRTRVERKLGGEFKLARAQLEARGGEAFLATGVPQRPNTVPLQAFYLPVLDLEKLSFLSESYFSWYEFALNSAAALVLAASSYTVVFGVLALRWSVPCSTIALYVGLPLATAAVLVWFLVEAAERNLSAFQERFIWFVVGALHFRLTTGQGGTTPPTAASAST
jgi:hypothetical protein